MPTIPIMSYNVFTTYGQTYFTGYPSSDNPYTDPVPNWGNTKYMFVKIKAQERINLAAAQIIASKIGLVPIN